MKLHGSNEVAVFRDGKRANLSNRSFWWIINRIVHSQQATILDGLSSIEKTTSAHEGSVIVESKLDVWGPRVIACRSDHDQPDTFYYVGLENLVIAYIDKVRKPIFDTIGRTPC